MRIWFDTEFAENGHLIRLISIGMVREDGKTFYAEALHSATLCRREPWLRDNVLPHLSGNRLSRRKIAEQVLEFAGDSPEFWAYYADYDWIVLCQLYGRMINLPRGWPMYCRDVKQLMDEMKVERSRLPDQVPPEHNALSDALWTRDAYNYLRTLG